MAPGRPIAWLALLAAALAVDTEPRTKISVQFEYEPDWDQHAKRTEGGRPPQLQLYWRRNSDGREMKWGALMAPLAPGHRVKSFVGDTWLVKESGSDDILRSFLLPEPSVSGGGLRVNVDTGEIGAADPVATPAKAKQPAKQSDRWAVELDLGPDYGFEFSAPKVAAERRVTLTRALEGAPDGSAESLYGVSLSDVGVVEGFRPAGVRPAEEARLLVGSRVVAINGASVQPKPGDADAAPGQVREAIRRELVAEGRRDGAESVWTIELPPEAVSPDRASGPPKDNPYLPPVRKQPCGFFCVSVERLFC